MDSHGKILRDGTAATAESFLAQLSDRARLGFLSLRALLVSLGPDVHELPEEDRVVYARARPFVEARRARKRLLVFFPEGDRLDDPLGRLLRKGHERYVRLESDELDAHLEEFVKKAYAQAR